MSRSVAGDENVGNPPMGGLEESERVGYLGLVMPIYEYRCESCSKVQEILQKVSDAPAEKCPDCGGPLQQLMSLGSFALKGSGWYSTDYKKSGSSSSGNKEA